MKIKKFKDHAIAISYKETNCNGVPLKSDINYKIVEKRIARITPFLLESDDAPVCEKNDLVPLQENYKGLSLEYQDNRWFIKDNLDGSLDSPKEGDLYIFVTMPNKTIRIAKRVTHGHLLLSDYAKYVRYAGEVCFDDEGNIEFWNNNSLSYCPPPVLAMQAGLEAYIKKFSLVIDRNDSNKDRHKALREDAEICVSNQSLFAKNTLRKSSSTAFQLYRPPSPISRNVSKEAAKVAVESIKLEGCLKRSLTI